MRYNELYAKSFKYGMMFGKDVKPGEPVVMSVTNCQDILFAIKKAYIDMSPRTFASKNKNNKKPLNINYKENLFKAMSEKFADYMKNGALDFNEWHIEMCEFFLFGDRNIKGFTKILKEADKDDNQATYGKAQKIVNMTFKYLYCFDNAEKYAERFQPCHMAIDRYILNWVVDKNISTNKLPPWSKLDKQQYIELQEAIRKTIHAEFGNVPRIEAEFLVWYNERKKVSRKRIG